MTIQVSGRTFNGPVNGWNNIEFGLTQIMNPAGFNEYISHQSRPGSSFLTTQLLQDDLDFLASTNAYNFSGTQQDGLVLHGAMLREHYQTSGTSAVPIDNILSYGVFLAGPNATTVGRIMSGDMVLSEEENSAGRGFLRDIGAGPGGDNYLCEWGSLPPSWQGMSWDLTTFLSEIAAFRTGNETPLMTRLNAENYVYTAIGVYGPQPQRFHGYAQADTIVGGAFGDVFDGRGGNDQIQSGGGNDEVHGGDGDDTLSGEDGNDTVTGDGGNDVLSGGAGADSLDGGTGWDVVDYASSGPGLGVLLFDASLNTGGAAGDRYTGIEAVRGSMHADVLVGDLATNGLLGGAGNDWLDGFGGGDVIFGEAGNDDLIARRESDELDGGTGFDFARYDFADSGLKAYLYDTSQNTGFAAGDTYASIEGLTGSNLTDDLRGDGNQNIIYGLEGDDFIVGLGESDLLIGGDGQDLFHFVGIGDGGPGGDAIQDFVSGQDRISVTGAFFGLGSPGGVPIDSFRFVTGSSANLATSQFIYNGATQQLFYDIDGTGAGVQVLLATLQAGATMAAGDIIVI
jgi:Ca2+-binding RTX toxin-like protein